LPPATRTKQNKEGGGHNKAKNVLAMVTGTIIPAQLGVVAR